MSPTSKIDDLNNVSMIVAEVPLTSWNNQYEQTTTAFGHAPEHIDPARVSFAEGSCVSYPPSPPSPRTRPAGPCETQSAPVVLPDSSLPTSRRRSSLVRWIPITLWKPRLIGKWRSPVLMVVFFIIGLVLSIAHCAYYPSLSGKIVGSPQSQQRNIQIGTACSFLAQLALTGSVWLSYFQWLWRTMQKSQWTVKALNKAFSVDTSPMSLLSFEIFRKFTIGSVMAFFAWCLILPPFFTPATLFVYPSMQSVQVEMLVPYLAIALSQAGSKFAYSPPMNPNTTKFINDVSKTFTGPRTILSLLSTATASQGKILSITPPYNHSEYSVSFYGPIIQCENANLSTTILIESFLDEMMTEQMGTAEAAESAYYAFVPARNKNGDLVALSKPRLQQPSNATNELWMTFERFVVNATGSLNTTRLHQVCSLYNATYDLQLAWDKGIQTVKGSYEVQEKVSFPQDMQGDVSNMAQHAYSAFFWSITDQIVGSFTWYNETETPGPWRPAQFGAIDSAIAHNGLLGSSDLDVFFWLDQKYGLYKDDNETVLSDQRLQDKALAKNRTLDVLIEELSFNTTVSLLQNGLLTYNTTANVTVWEDVNRYGYLPHTLFVPYALANLFTFITAILGLYSYRKHGVLRENKFQDIVSAAENPEVVKVIGTGNVNGRRATVTMGDSGLRLVVSEAPV